MDEYINKQVLIRMFNAKSDMALGTPKVVFGAAAKMVEKLPAADVVSVVRCRDCRFWKKDLHYCEYFDFCITVNDFCSYGERRDEK